ncbi:MAG: Do family serine endopeptidase, partial [Elusimicrobia bacterium]|nr:Do family serine endopeptidase [Elusimicrobiota bacterium]
FTFYLLLFTYAHGASPALSSLQDAFASVAEKAKPAVVNITAIHEERGYVQSPQFFFGDPDEFLYHFFRGQPEPRTRPYRWKTQGVGSGVLIDDRGYVITNEHVIRGADEIKITLTLPNGKDKTVTGKVVGKDSNMDVAVVKIQTPGTYPYLKLADSSKIRVGDWAIAIGSPFELEQTVTVGILSAIRQSLLIEGRKYNNLLQTDAAINRGNSGGPLLNIEGEVIGINTAIFSPSGSNAGIGFAISINEVKEILADLLEGKSIRAGWLGIDLAPLDEVIQKKFGLPNIEGAIINSVIENSPASKAGLKRGDVILKFNDHSVRTPHDLVRLVGRTPPGKTASLEIYRRNKHRIIPVILGERPEWIESGIRRRPAPAEETPKQQTSFQWEGLDLAQEKGGVLIKRVSPDSKLYGYLLEGDLIQGVNQTSVSTLQDFRNLSSEIRLKEGVVFDILRQGQAMYISVQIAN